MRKIYKSKVDIWLVIVIIFLVTASIVPSLVIDFSWYIVLIVGVILSVPLYIMFSIRYIIDGDVLMVEYRGLSKTSYDINQIVKIEKTATTLSSPAASLDRIAISFLGAKTKLVISPSDRDAFIADLTHINPEIKLSK